ncbi:MAG: Uma2 family endonuclease [Burkholderiales bacterium]
MRVYAIALALSHAGISWYIGAMNKHLDIALRPRPHEPLRPAPRKYTAADIFFFLEAGLIDEKAKFELLNGEIVPMSPKGNHHEVAREILLEWLFGTWIAPFRLMVEHTLTLGDNLIVEPDFIIYDRATRIQDRKLTGADLRLVIEVADTSLVYDLNEKADIYAKAGALEYWVVNAISRDIRVHRSSTASGWSNVQVVVVGQPVAPRCAPAANFVMPK